MHTHAPAAGQLTEAHTLNPSARTVLKTLLKVSRSGLDSMGVLSPGVRAPEQGLGASAAQHTPVEARPEAGGALCPLPSGLSVQGMNGAHPIVDQGLPGVF